MVGFIRRHHVFAERQVGVTFDRDLLVVVDPAEIGPPFAAAHC